MESRTFQAREIKEALALVRRELGRDAVILGTRRVPGRAFGLLGGTLIEVTAAPGEPAPKPRRPQNKPQARGADRRHRTLRMPAVVDPEATAARARPLLAAARAERAKTLPISRRPVRTQIADDPEAALGAVAGHGGAVRPHATLRRRLLAAMVPRDLCETWLRRIPDLGSNPSARAGEEGQLRNELRRVLGAPAPLVSQGRRIAVLVGPTGVGKTTTIAKLAAQTQLLEGRSVALVSTDDERIGGTTALRSYGRVLGVPVTTVTEAGGLDRALAYHRDADLILVDTAGISPGNSRKHAVLAKRLSRAGEPITTHLCIAASTRHEELDRCLHLYAPTNPSALLITKVDEAVAVGSVFAARCAQANPLSYATTGQQVPEDITPAAADFFIDLLLGAAA